jgi:predicted dehydrogenase
LDEHDAEFDAVVIRLPLAEREGAIRQAAGAGKHILVKAPCAATVAATEAIIDQCAEARVCLAISDTLRFHPSSQTIMGRLADGKLGTPGLLRVHRWRPSRAAAPATLSEHVFADVDLALCLFGESPNSVYAIGRAAADPPVGNTAMPDYLQVHIGFPAGGMAILDFTTALPSGQHYDSLSLIGSNGAAYADDHQNTHLLYGGGHPAALVSAPGHLHIVREHQAFVDAILDQTPPPAGGEDCRKGLQLVDAILQSLESGQVWQAKGASHGRV